MLIALLIALGVELIVIVAVATLVFGRKRWLKRQPGEFKGAIRVSSGEIDGLKTKWKRGSGRWVRDILVWSEAPLLLRNVLVPVDRVTGELQATDVKHLGDNPVVIEFVRGDAKIDVAAKAEHLALMTGTWSTDATSAARAAAPV